MICKPRARRRGSNESRLSPFPAAVIGSLGLFACQNGTFPERNYRGVIGFDACYATLPAVEWKGFVIVLTTLREGMSQMADRQSAPPLDGMHERIRAPLRTFDLRLRAALGDNLQ